VTYLSSQSLRNGGFVISPDGVMFANPASIDLRSAEEIELEPGEFALASTYETVWMPDHCIGFVCGKSSNARCGLLVEAAGLVDPGFRGTITLELCNLSDNLLSIREGLRICQLSVCLLDRPTDMPYHQVGHYFGQTGPTPSWYGLGPRGPR
jgi:dCTP deaminase